MDTIKSLKTAKEKYVVPSNVIILLLLAAAAVGLVEGLAWSILSFIAICYYGRTFMPSKDATYSQNHIDRTMYDFYLNHRYESTLEDIMKEYTYPLTATPFCVCMIISLTINIILVIYSCVILWILYYKKQIYIKHTIGSWAVTMATNITFDLILLLLLSINYSSIKKFQASHASGPSASDSVVLAATGVVITLAARGFILWVVNAIIAGLMGKLWHSYHRRIPFFNYERFDNTSVSNLPWMEEPYQYCNSTVSIDRMDNESSSPPYAKLKPLDLQRSPNNQMTRALNMDVIQTNNNKLSNRFQSPKELTCLNIFEDVTEKEPQYNSDTLIEITTDAEPHPSLRFRKSHLRN
ncbi:uncharacterized protein LOC143197953 isoform X2 [Rhynchophorus ferrugineus]|uniref:uncharacterized protein LOC143197953 isoform X2 n=1 Tax=Rhynchophorus ferrugineus TaxID=354439 RepID=UPI003FCD7CC9